MNTFGNICWFILGGFICAVLYFVAGLVLCVTIIGIPFGVQLWKFARLALCPFGHEVVPDGDMGCWALGFNLLWILFGWWEIALVHALFGLIFCVTIVGIPLGYQHFKLAGYSLVPFGRTIK